MTKVKICGITNLEDAQAAVDYGADLLGFIFAQSPRKINKKQVKNIQSQLPKGIKTVGVFANQPVEEIQNIIDYCQLDYIQLHGSESPEYCQEFELPIIKAFRVKDEAYLDKLSEYKIDKYLLDTYHPDKLGGVGKVFNWDLALKAKEYGDIIIAGGLNPDNIGEAIKVIAPYGVDVSSGVEAKTAKKDLNKMKNFIDNAKNFE
ncbi:phosphoribosylanthranilate isomerase [Orenia marismortui]|nr:phosphoribosylanthranilate isomerase [Orenia marismortui]